MIFTYLAGLSLFTLLTQLLPTASAAYDPTNKACGRALGGSAILTAAEAHECLTSTPFREDIAKELLDYWKTTLKFQSTLPYLRDPPRAYQQPPIDVLRGFDLIRAQIDAGVFDNQYAFEAAVQTLLLATHDGSISLAGSVLGVFTFGAPRAFVSVSSDGVSVPKVYDAVDLKLNPNASPVAKINGTIAEDFLAVFASENSFGYLEPHGDWNGLFYSPAAEILGVFGSITETVFYPGDDFTIEFANGTKSAAEKWLAYNVQGDDSLASVQTGLDFYNFFVLGQLPSITANLPTSTIDNQSPPTTFTSSAEETLKSWASISQGYPTVADIVQDGLGEGGVLTGYFLTAIKTAVISIPSFGLTGEAATSFSRTIALFIQQSQIRGMERILIDLQQNYGGDRLLARDTFNQFFPNTIPYSGMRIRSWDLVDDLGNTYTSLYQSYLNGQTSLNDSFAHDLATTNFNVLNLLNADTKRKYKSWPEFIGPRPDRGDEFSTVFSFDPQADMQSAQDSKIDLVTVSGKPTRQPFAAQDIVILTDASCSAVCDMFVEMMHHEAGVRTVVVGGLPQHGPMQARGAGRGAVVHDSLSLDSEIIVSCYENKTLCSSLPKRTSAATDQSQLTINLADQIRPREYVPLQFVYEAADCRIFWKRITLYNVTALWEHAAEATFRNGSLCVPRSAEHKNTMETDLLGPALDELTSWAATNPAWVAKNNMSRDGTSGLAQEEYDPGLSSLDKRGDFIGQPAFRNPNQGKSCTRDSECVNANQLLCVFVWTQCGNEPARPIGTCQQKCQTGSSGSVRLNGAACPAGVGLEAQVRNPANCQGRDSPSCQRTVCYCDSTFGKRAQGQCAAIATAVLPQVTNANPGPDRRGVKSQRRGIGHVR